MKGSTVDLTTIKVGDEVAWLHGFRTPVPVLAEVIKLTPTQIVAESPTGRQCRFRREDGRKIGADSYGCYLLSRNDPWVLDALAMDRMQRLHFQLARRIGDFRGSKTPDAALTHLRDLRMQITSAIEEIGQLAKRSTQVKADGD